jgi:pentose-5-phosphate-3-epimerase/putative flippase GtrA
MRQKLARRARRLRRLASHSRASFLIYRYRYLAKFALIGFLSILLEVQLTRVLPAGWPWLAKACAAFGLGLLVSFGLNATVNFRVPTHYLLRTFYRFALVSCLSFGLNMVAVYGFREWSQSAYGEARLLSSGVLFLIAYWLHSRFTFNLTRNFGIAVYASQAESVRRIFHCIGRSCDHVHVDLVDETMNRLCSPVDLGKLRAARERWPGVPLSLHVMSLNPSRWLEQTWRDVDWYLFHLNVREDLHTLIAQCRLRGKKVGVVWHQSVTTGELLPLLPHVDFVMVLGIAEPGRSGQSLLAEAVEVAAALDRLRSRYGYELMFDGGVNASTIGEIRAKYIVAASAVLRARDPVQVSHYLKTTGKYERRAA